MSKRRVYERYKRFKDGHKDVDRSWHLSTSTTENKVQNMKNLIVRDLWLTIIEVADDAGLAVVIFMIRA